MRTLIIAGSPQQHSANRALLRAAVREAPDQIDMVVYDSLAELPHFNPELDGEGEEAPAPVRELRAQLTAADAVVIVSPEYAHSMPGLVKNALDWVVGSGELAGMPIALMSASTTTTGGARGQIALTITLLGQAGNVVAWLTVPGVRRKLDGDGELSDTSTLRRVRETLHALAEAAD
ncbi:MAG: NADPH-dependent FMN reductase [Thermoleophilaceae bacterium]